MRIPKKAHELVLQNEKIVKKPHKHDANLQKNSTLYFQVGLIVCLLATYGLFEMKFETALSKEVAWVLPPDGTTEVSVDKFKVYMPKEEVIPEPKKKVVLTSPPKIVDNDYKITKVIDVITGDQNTTSDKILKPGDIHVDVVPEEIPIPIAFVEQVPIYPGCENKKTNSAKRKCMSEKISKLIRKKFDSNLAGELGLSGKQKIDVQFKIDKTGHVTDIKIRAPHPKLASEAKRVIGKIPEMTPGKQQKKAVGVIYTLPIIFKVEN